MNTTEQYLFTNYSDEFLLTNVSSIQDVMLKCSIYFENNLENYSMKTESQKILHNCEYCPLSESELKILYSDSTCLSLSYGPLICLFYSLVFVLGVLGNVIVLWSVFCGGKALSSVMHLFIANLALGDLCMVLFCVPFSSMYIVLQYWPFGYAMCMIVSYLQAVSVFVSAYSLVAISMDRYMAIIYPLRPRFTKIQARLIIVLVWIMALITCLPVALVSDVQVPESNSYYKYNNLEVCREVWSPQQHVLRKVYAVALLMLHYFFPIAVIIFTYTRIFWRVWGSNESAAARAIKARVILSRTPSGVTDNQSSPVALSMGASSLAPPPSPYATYAPPNVGGIDHSPAKMIRVTVTVVFVYSLCWLPFNMLMVSLEYDEELTLTPSFHLLWAFCHWLAMAHTVFNPAILYWLNTTFRKVVLRLMYKLLPAKCRRCFNMKSNALQRTATCTTSCAHNLRYQNRNNPTVLTHPPNATDDNLHIRGIKGKKSATAVATEEIIVNDCSEEIRIHVQECIWRQNRSKSNSTKRKAYESKNNKTLEPEDSPFAKRKADFKRDEPPDQMEDNFAEIVLPDSNQHSAFVKYRRNHIL